MSAIQHDAPGENLEIPDHELDGGAAPDALVAPRRRRWHLFNRKTAALGAAVACAAGFLAGVELEKSQATGIPTTPTAPTAGGAAAGAGAGGRGGFPFAGRGAGGGNASFGTISSVSGNTVYVTEASGNTVKVTLSPATKVTKSQSVTKSSLRPGDAVVIQGATSSNGTVSATSVSDSGTGPARIPTGTGSGSGTTG
jgi:hypothetical protein